MVFELTSPAFDDGARIPDRYTCKGADVSPALRWAGAPDGTLCFVLLCEDPDAPRGTWHHWAAFDIPPEASGLPEAYPKDAHVDSTCQAVNDFGRSGYGGPCPPPGHGDHRYHFRLLALGVERLELGATARCPEVEAAARPHVLAEARLTGTYSR